MSYLWENVNDERAFEGFIEAQGIPVIRVPLRTVEEAVPELEPITGATYPCGEAWESEDDATRMLQAEEMRTEMLWRNLDQMTHKRDFWVRCCGVATGLAIAALIVLVAVWR